MECAVHDRMICELQRVAVQASTYPDFTGAGVAVCERIDSIPHAPLVQKRPVLPQGSLAEGLIRLSSRQCRHHDGFHLLSESLGFLEVACYIAPHIPPNLTAFELGGGGCRHATAYLLSLHSDVLCTGIVDSDCRVTVFSNGRRADSGYRPCDAIQRPAPRRVSTEGVDS